MAQGSVTVNGRPVAEYLGKEKSKEVHEFYIQELRWMGRVGHRPIVSSQRMQNQTTKVESVGNNKIRCS